MQPADGDQVSEPSTPQAPPAGPSPEADTTRLPWAPAEPAPAEPAPTPVAPTRWTQPGEPKPPGWTEPQGFPMTACLVIILIGVVLFVGLILALIYLGSQVSTILSSVGDSI